MDLPTIITIESPTLQHPKKEYLEVQIDLNSVEEDHKTFVSEFKKNIEKNVFKWNTQYQIEAPTTIFDGFDIRQLNLYPVPEFDECKLLATNQDGSQKKLSEDQLRQIRETGRINVPSQQFPGERHVWKINSLLQTGTQNIYSNFQNKVSLALKFLIILCAKRFKKDNKFSVISSFKHLWRAFYDLIDLLFGLSHTNAGNLREKLRDEKLKYLGCELQILSSNQASVNRFWDCVERCTQHNIDKERRCSVSPLSYQFMTPSKLIIDLRLMNSQMNCAARSLIESLLIDMKQESKNWLPKFTADFTKDLIERNGKVYSNKQLKKLAQNAASQEFQSRLVSAIRATGPDKSSPFDAIAPGLAAVVANEFEASIVRARHWHEAEAQLSREMREFDARLQTDHPIRCRIKEWRIDRLFRFFHNKTSLPRVILASNNSGTASSSTWLADFCNTLITKYSQSELHQHAYFLQRSVVFHQERSARILEKLREVTTFPDQIFTLSVPLLLPQWWTVTFVEFAPPPRHHRDQQSQPQSQKQLVAADAVDDRETPPVDKELVEKENNQDFSVAMDNVIIDSQAEKVDTLNAREAEIAASDDDRAVANCVWPRRTRLTRNLIMSEPRAASMSSLEKKTELLNQVLTANRITRKEASIDESHEFQVSQSWEFRVSTRYPGWQITLFFCVWLKWTLVIGQTLLIHVPFRSKLSFRALFAARPFYTNFGLNRQIGVIFPLHYDGGGTLSLRHRLTRLADYVARSRDNFEQRSHHGLIDKRVARHFHRFYCYVVLLAGASLCLCVGMPIACLLISSLALLVGLISPLLALCAALLWFLPVRLLLYNRYDVKALQLRDHHPRRTCCCCIPRYFVRRALPLVRIFIYEFLMCGVLQLAAALVFALVASPLCSLAVAVYGCVELAAHQLWDAFVYHAIIRRSSSVPASDTFSAKRISGPGLSTSGSAELYYSMSSQQMMLIFQAELERKELQLWHDKWMSIIDAPLENFNSFTSKLLGYFSARISESHPLKLTLEQQNSELKSQLNKFYEKRNKLLNHILNRIEVLRKIKLPQQQLRESLDGCTKLCQNFYEKKIRGLLMQSAQSSTASSHSQNDKIVIWWNKFGVECENFAALTQHVLEQLFSEDVLTSLEEFDRVYELRVDELNLAKYFDMLDVAEYRELEELRPGDAGASSCCVSKHQFVNVKLYDIDFDAVMEQCQPNSHRFPVPLESHVMKKRKKTSLHCKRVLIEKLLKFDVLEMFSSSYFASLSMLYSSEIWDGMLLHLNKDNNEWEENEKECEAAESEVSALPGRMHSPFVLALLHYKRDRQQQQQLELNSPHTLSELKALKQDLESLEKKVFTWKPPQDWQVKQETSQEMEEEEEIAAARKIILGRDLISEAEDLRQQRVTQLQKRSGQTVATDNISTSQYGSLDEISAPLIIHS